MSLKQRLLDDMRTAMKNRDAFRKNILSMARAAILQVEKDQRVDLDDQGVIEVLSKEAKLRKEAIEDFRKGNRQDLVEKNEREIEILQEYLPQQLSEEEIEEIVKQTINEVGANSIRDMGKVMGAIMPKVKGRADGSVVNRFVKEYLQ
ncbi:MAG: GatB/YqeY domain-containing protein [Bacillota bacterium]|nr:GatB/YqeY domain-containing protein [Bacillota bacterium]